MSEMVSAKLSRLVLHGNMSGKPLHVLRISEMDARTLADEMAGLAQSAVDPCAYELFDSMVCGRVKFMDVPIEVEAPKVQGLQPGAINRVILPAGGFRAPRDGEVPELSLNEILDDLRFKSG